ncbi:MAG TPA: formate dehydrogenase subunit gamma [Burkholderiales bacterium]|jgi:formate dehydrogenase subunit gamma|nr:formate dehydrogenase subunit gamma [Burkholderiales bacterium]
MPQSDHAAVIGRVIEQRRHLAGALLPILHGIQEALGHVPAQAVPQVAAALNLSRAEVHGVVSFYHDFRSAPPGRHTIHLCRAEACQSMGADKLIAHARARLGIDLHQTSADGAVSLEPVYCLGNCACSPAMQVDGQLVGRVTPDRFDEVLGQLEGAK